MYGSIPRLRRPSGTPPKYGGSFVGDYRRLLGYVRPYLKRALVATAALMLISVGSALPIQIIRYTLDFAAARTGELTTIYLLGASFLVLSVLIGLLQFVQNYLLAQVGNRVVFDLRCQMYEHLCKLSLRFYEKRQTGEIMSRIIGDIDTLESLVWGPLASFLGDSFKLLSVLGFCIWMDWKLTILALLVGPPLGVFVVFLGRKIRAIFRTVREKVADLNALLQDNISGVRVVKGFAREEHELHRFEQRGEEVYDSSVRGAKLYAIAFPTIQGIMAIGTVVVLLYGGAAIYRGTMTAGTFMAFVMYVAMLYQPLIGISRIYGIIQRALAASDRVFEMLDTEPEIVDRPDAVALEKVEGHVRFEDVSFSYDEGVEVLSDIDFEARPGEMVALVGPSGAGKTTIANLVPRFYDVTQGRVLVDGHDVRDVTQRSLRQNIGMVLQETFLFNGTIKENIAYGKLGASDEEIFEAARAANADEFIDGMPDEYDTQIGERGVKLSGGQKQRVAIARAILNDPAILILDEATSSVDTETEILIQKAIERLVADRTTLVIAHRLSTILHADQILVLDEGRIIERGTHGELLANDDLYARLHAVQFTAPPLEREEPAVEAPAASEELEDDLPAAFGEF